MELGFYTNQCTHGSLPNRKIPFTQRIILEVDDNGNPLYEYRYINTGRYTASLSTGTSIGPWLPLVYSIDILQT